jgi:hypothetical protein
MIGGLMPHAPLLAHWRITDEIPLRLPLLDRWLERSAHERPLEGVTVLNIQHQLGNHVPQTAALIELGVSPRAVHWIEIPYSATPAVREVLYALGIPKENILVSDFRLLDDMRITSEHGYNASYERSQTILRSASSYLMTAPTCSRAWRRSDDRFRQ